MKKILVSLKDFTRRPHSLYEPFFKDNKVVNIFEVIEIIWGEILWADVAWAINHCPKLQKPKTLQAIIKEFINHKPPASKIFYFMSLCDLVRNDEMKKAFWDANPGAEDIQSMLSEKLIVETKEVKKLFLEKIREYVKEFLATKPSIWEIRMKLIHFPMTQIPEMLEGFLAANPSADEIYELICDFEFARTPEIMAEFIRLNPNKKFLNGAKFTIYE